jgi:hypothetical protein
MNGVGTELGKALRQWTMKVFPSILHVLNTERVSRADTDKCMWIDDDYPQLLETIAALPDFGGDKKMADAYLCGYRRGLRQAGWQMLYNFEALEPQLAELERQRKAQRRKSRPFARLVDLTPRRWMA